MSNAKARHNGGRFEPLVKGSRGGSDPRHPIVAQIREEFDLETPGVAAGLARLARMRKDGEEITIDVARAVIRTCIEYRVYEDRKAEEKKRGEVVYYMRLGDMVKIGWTTNLPKRTRTINPQEVMATEPGDMKLERQRHRQFADLRVHGEWFRYEGPLIQWIQALREAPCGTTNTPAT